ncbi:hypothetical protein TGMAS_247290, partial [Toxoplasma gondii MAS]
MGRDLVISYVHSLCPSLPMAAIGLSLGGNTLLRLLSPLSAPEPAFSPPGALAQQAAAATSASVSTRPSGYLTLGRPQAPVQGVYLQPTLLPPACCSCCDGDAPFPCATTLARVQRAAARRVRAQCAQAETERRRRPLETGDGAGGPHVSTQETRGLRETPPNPKNREGKQEEDEKESVASARGGLGPGAFGGSKETHAGALLSSFEAPTATRSRSLSAELGCPEAPLCVQGNARDEREDAVKTQRRLAEEVSLDACEPKPGEGEQPESFVSFVAGGGQAELPTAAGEPDDDALQGDHGPCHGGVSLSDDADASGEPTGRPLRGRGVSNAIGGCFRRERWPPLEGDSTTGSGEKAPLREGRSATGASLASEPQPGSGPRPPSPLAETSPQTRYEFFKSRSDKVVESEDRAGRRTKRDERRGVGAAPCMRGTAGLPFPRVLPSSAALVLPAAPVSPARRRLETDGRGGNGREAREDRAKAGAEVRRGASATSLSISATGAAALSYLGGLWSFASSGRTVQRPEQRPDVSSASMSRTSLWSETGAEEAGGAGREPAEAASSSSALGTVFPPPGSGHRHPGRTASAQAPLSLDVHAGEVRGDSGRGVSVPVASILSAVVCVGPFLEMHRCNERRNASFAGLFDWLSLTGLATDGIVSWLHGLVTFLSSFFERGATEGSPTPATSRKRGDASGEGPDDDVLYADPEALFSFPVSGSSLSPPNITGETKATFASSSQSVGNASTSARGRAQEQEGDTLSRRSVGDAPRTRSLMALPPSLPAHFCCPCALQRWLAAYAEALFFEGAPWGWGPGEVRPARASGPKRGDRGDSGRARQ